MTHAPSEYDPRPRRPASPKVFGILSIIFASLVLLGGLMGSCALGAEGMIRATVPHAEMMNEAFLSAIGGVYTTLGIQSIVLAAMSAWLLAIGIGQVRYRRWAARQSVAWGALALVCVVGMVLAAVLITGPASEALLEATVRMEGMHMGRFRSMGGMGGLSSMLSVGGALGAVFVYAPYPILLLIFFRNPKVVSAMS